MKEDSLFNMSNHLNIDETLESKLYYAGNYECKPVISILMPIYNHPDYFEQSLLSAVHQKFDLCYEIIVVDNNHPHFQKVNQQIIEKVNSDIVKYYVNSHNIGACGNWNRAITLANSEYVTFCHDDDLLHEDTLAELWKVKNQFADNSLIISSMNHINDKGEYTFREDEKRDHILFFHKKKIQKLNLSDFLVSNYTNGCGALYSRDKLFLLGGFSSDYSPCPDYALNAKYTYYYGAYKINVALFDYRISEQSDTANCFTKIANTNKVIQNNIVSKFNFLFRPLCKLYVDFKCEVTNYEITTKWKQTEAVKPSLVKRGFVSCFASIILLKKFF